jgi:hypothetical protein
MAPFACSLNMLPYQREFRCIMVERVNFFVNLPTLSAMANIATYIKVIAMRRFSRLFLFTAIANGNLGNNKQGR